MIGPAQGREGRGGGGGGGQWWDIAMVERCWCLEVMGPVCPFTGGGGGGGSGAHEHSVMCVGWVHACYGNAGNILIRAC